MIIYLLPRTPTPGSAPLTLRPASRDTFAVVARSGAVLAIVPRADAPIALHALALRKPARACLPFALPSRAA